MLDHSPVAFSLSIILRVVTTSGDVPMLLMNPARSVSVGSMDAATAARDAMSGLLAHQTWSWFTGGCPASAPPSRNSFNADFVDGQPVFDEAAG